MECIHKGTFGTGRFVETGERGKECPQEICGRFRGFGETWKTGGGFSAGYSEEVLADSTKTAKRMNDSIAREAKIQAKQMKKQADRMRKDSIAAAKDSLERMKNVAPSVSEVPIDSVAHTEETLLPEPLEFLLPEIEPEEPETPPSETDGEDNEKPVPDEPSKDGEEENPVPEEEPAEPEDEQSQNEDIQTLSMRLGRHGMRYEVSEREEGGQKS